MFDGIERLWEIIARLRGPGGCPWDREQSPGSVKKYVLEESCELIDAVEDGDLQEIKEEFGDLFFMLLFLGFMFEEREEGFIEEALEHAREKMVRRHPHVFGDVQVESSRDVKLSWQAIKAKEARDKGKRESVLGNVPLSLPSLQRAFRLGERASRVGFDWDSIDGVWRSLRDEEEELQDAVYSGDRQGVFEEIGDVLFTLSNLSRHLGVNPEDALKQASKRFEKRFRRMEEVFKKKGKPLSEAGIDEMDAVWKEVKYSSR